MLPETDGFTLAETIRAQNEIIPIIFLTAKAAQDDKLKGLRIGADDYIVKPFNIEELVLRVAVFLKRSSQAILPTFTFSIGSYIFNYKNLTLCLENKTRNLTQMETELLRNLCINKGEVIKREKLLTDIWGNNDYFTGRSLDVFISRLRKYLQDDQSVEIQNIHSVGFRLNFR